jgi:hypothetical protein
MLLFNLKRKIISFKEKYLKKDFACFFLKVSVNIKIFIFLFLKQDFISFTRLNSGFRFTLFIGMISPQGFNGF